MFRFIVRGGMALGLVVHGATLPEDCSWTLFKNDSYRDKLLLGLPMVQAHQAETNAPPFGVYVHESARSFSPPGTQPFHNVWWDWFRGSTDLRNQLSSKLQEHYVWCRAHASQLEYQPERIAVHEKMAKEYLEETPISD